MCVWGGGLQVTVSHYSWLMRALTWGQALHLEHHDFPQIACRHLPKLRDIAPEFYVAPRIKRFEWFWEPWVESLFPDPLSPPMYASCHPPVQTRGAGVSVRLQRLARSREEGGSLGSALCGEGMDINARTGSTSLVPQHQRGQSLASDGDARLELCGGVGGHGEDAGGGLPAEWAGVGLKLALRNKEVVVVGIEAGSVADECGVVHEGQVLRALDGREVAQALLHADTRAVCGGMTALTLGSTSRVRRVRPSVLGALCPSEDCASGARTQCGDPVAAQPAEEQLGEAQNASKPLQVSIPAASTAEATWRGVTDVQQALEGPHGSWVTLDLIGGVACPVDIQQERARRSCRRALAQAAASATLQVHDASPSLAIELPDALIMSTGGDAVHDVPSVPGQHLASGRQGTLCDAGACTMESLSPKAGGVDRPDCAYLCASSPEETGQDGLGGVLGAGVNGSVLARDMPLVVGLVDKTSLSHDTRRFRFSLPEPHLGDINPKPSLALADLCVRLHSGSLTPTCALAHYTIFSAWATGRRARDAGG